MNKEKEETIIKRRERRGKEKMDTRWIYIILLQKQSEQNVGKEAKFLKLCLEKYNDAKTNTKKIKGSQREQKDTSDPD